MKRQKKKQEKLILKMLPKEVVAKLNEGLNTAEEFESEDRTQIDVKIKNDNSNKALHDFIGSTLTSLVKTMHTFHTKHTVEDKS